ncbi:MAG TPA: phosphate ABC transporter substrate-binding/OmpA family protein [Vicinamibacterales bacterium]|jgi:NitT/TauT family transport system substrate-binding protein
MNDQPRFTILGKLISSLLVIGLVGLGVYMIQRGRSGGPSPASTPSAENAPSADVTEIKAEVPRLSPPAPVQIKDNIIPIEISEYAGYAGLIAANGGLEPTENSYFFKNHGFKVRLTVKEDEAWSEFNEGKMAASATTVDVLAAYGKQLHAVVPAQIGFSRGADAIVVKSDIKRINQLKGKIIATAQFTEVDFFVRYLAQEAGLPINMLASLDAAPHPDRLNLVYTEEGFGAGDLFLKELKSGKNRLAGAVTWEPKVSEVVDGSGGQAHVLVSNRNLLIIADVLIVHRGFAQENPKIVDGIVQGLLEGNRMVRDRPDQYLGVVASAFKWSRDDAKSELANVHLANLPENLAFFSGAIDAAGSFEGIYQSAVLAYGSDLIRDPPDATKFTNLAALHAIDKAGVFKEQKVAIAPIKAGGSTALEADPLLSKDIRFLFEPNSDKLDLQNQDNIKNLDSIKRLVQISPGSRLLLRGHVDNARIEEFRKKGGDVLVRSAALSAMDLSKRRAGEIRRLLVDRYQIDAGRIDIVGRGWEEPAGPNSDLNRRVEVQWFTIE